MFTDSMTAPPDPSPSDHDEVTSPDATPEPSDADETSQVKALRDKIREQGEENKRLREMYDRTTDRLDQLMLQVGQGKNDEPKDDTPDFAGLVDSILSEDASPEDSKRALMEFGKAAAEMGRRGAVEELEAKYGTQIQSQQSSIAENVAERFFAEKGIPEMGRDGSEFFQFVKDEIRNDKGMLALWSSQDYKSAIEYTWMKFVQKRGDPTTKKKERLKQHEDASMTDVPTLPDRAPADFDRYLKAEEGKGESDFERIHNALKRSGAFKGR